MKKRSKIILASVLAIGVTSGVFAFGSHHHFSNMSVQEKAEMINYRISRKLDLNSEQEVNLELLTGRVSELMQQVHENKKSHVDQIGEFLTEEPLDQTALLEKISNKTTLVNQHAPEMVGLLAGFVDSLDNEQKQEIKRMIEKRHGKHRFGRYDDHQEVFRD